MVFVVSEYLWAIDWDEPDRRNVFLGYLKKKRFVYKTKIHSRVGKDSIENENAFSSLSAFLKHRHKHSYMICEGQCNQRTGWIAALILK